MKRMDGPSPKAWAEEVRERQDWNGMVSPRISIIVVKRISSKIQVLWKFVLAMKEKMKEGNRLVY